MPCVPEDWISSIKKCDGKCTALVRVNAEHPSCNEICAAQYMHCAGAWDDKDNGECSLDAEKMSCAYEFPRTSDAVCQCSPAEYRKVILSLWYFFYLCFFANKGLYVKIITKLHEHLRWRQRCTICDTWSQRSVPSREGNNHFDAMYRSRSLGERIEPDTCERSLSWFLW